MGHKKHFPLPEGNTMQYSSTSVTNIDQALMTDDPKNAKFVKS